MSKEDLTCKVSSVCKHKERKPKKPHYIPRPWGKPYNYKCFQCPFTCMEKSHLYNHMKYSLCKNSLSLLIESDWPYKKGNLLHAEQLRPLQQESRLRGTGREEVEPLLGQDGQPRIQQVTFVREPEVVEEHRIVGEGPGDETEENMLTKEASDQTDGSPSRTTKGSKQADFVITDVFSLEDQLLKARSVEVEAKLKHYKLSKTCLTGPSLLSEQWRLLSSSHRKAKSESTAPNSGSMPCYPPPPSFADCPEPPGLNLSVLGLSYQLNPGLFSYVNPTVPGAATAHTQMAQLPFLASTAQFMHPATSSLSHADRSLLPPRFYYPLLCEHSFGGAQMEARKGFKPGQSPPSNLDPNSPASFTPKVNLWKVPALRPNSNSPSPWASQPHVTMSSEAGFRVAEEKAPCKDGKEWSLKSSPEVTPVREQGNKRTGAPLDMHEGPAEKKSTTGCTLDLLKNIHTFPSISMTTDKLPHHNSFKSTQHHSKPLEEWLKNVRRSSPESLLGDMLPPQKAVERAGSHNPAKSRQKEQDPESAAELLSDLSKALQEYQEAERKISHLVKEDLPGQRYLWEHLCKIRNELSHIHQALEREARQNEGPLDLSVKKDQGMTGDGDSKCLDESIKGSVIGETEEEDDEDDEEEEGSKKEGKAESYESHRQSLDVLIKTNRTGLTDVSLETVVKTEVLSPSGLSLHATPAEALWQSRTTKCEADSSVLCPDGRSLVFTDFTPVAKRIRRPSSREHLGETLCTPSPLTASDS